MKISMMNNSLGRKEINRGNERRLDAIKGDRFKMSIRDIGTHGVNVKLTKDKLGLVMSGIRLGDRIPETIRTCMNICAVDFSQFIGEDGRLGENAVHVALISAKLYWQVYDKETKSLNMDKAKEIVAQRKGQKMAPIYEAADEMMLSNKFSMIRKMYGMNNYYLKRTELALLAINEDTTLEELELFQSQFAYPTRGLGEQTIDIMKHTDCVYDYVVNDLISPYISVVGGIKKLNSNIKSYRRDKKPYEITAPKEDITNNLRLPRVMDVIGKFKQASVDVMEAQLNNYISILEKETNYSMYKKYENYQFTKETYELACLIFSIGDAIMSMDKQDSKRALAAIYNKADELAIPRKEVFQIAMKVAVSDVRRSKDGVSFVPVIGTDMEYRADIWRVAAIFGDVFVQEYAEVEHIEVPVDYEASADIPAGIYDLVDGYACNNNLHIISPYQNGKVEVKDGSVVALYNPIEEITKEHPHAMVIEVEAYAKEECKFSNFVKASVEDLEEGNVVGYEAAKNCAVLRVANPGDGQYCIVAIAKDKTITAAAKASASFSAKSKDILAENVVCYKSLIIADVK